MGSSTNDQRTTSNTEQQSACPQCSHGLVVNPTTPEFIIDESTNVPILVPLGLLVTPEFEPRVDPAEELKLLKSQISDVARVCNAVSRGDLSRKITAPTQGVVMTQIKDVVNNMVGCYFYKVMSLCS